jgi:hypothetical protein
LEIAQGVDASVDLRPFGNALSLATIYDGIAW